MESVNILWISLLTVCIVGFGAILYYKINYKTLIEYYPSGALHRKIKLKKGLRHGSEYVYFRDGALNKKKYWSNNLPVKVSLTFYSDGLIYCKEYYENNQLSKVEVFDRLGKVIFTKNI